MSVRKLTAAETEALLTDLSSRSTCTNGCKCIFCRTFDDGVQSGRHDAQIEFARSLEELMRKHQQ
jgi:hypothetical protein